MEQNLPAINLQTLIATLLQGVQAQNLIATRINSLTTQLGVFATDFTDFTTAFTTAFPIFTGSATWDPPSLVSGSSEIQTVTVSGVTLGMPAIVSFSLDLQGLSLNAYVSAANTVTAVLSNLTGGTLDLSSGTLKVKVFGA